MTDESIMPFGKYKGEKVNYSAVNCGELNQKMINQKNKNK